MYGLPFVVSARELIGIGLSWDVDRTGCVSMHADIILETSSCWVEIALYLLKEC